MSMCRERILVIVTCNYHVSKNRTYPIFGITFPNVWACLKSVTASGPCHGGILILELFGGVLLESDVCFLRNLIAKLAQ